jgi:hypothetical protein
MSAPKPQPGAQQLQRRAVYSDDEIRIDHFADVYTDGAAGRTLVITFDPILYGVEKPPFGFDFLRKQGVDILAVRKHSENFYQPLSRETFLRVAAQIADAYTRVIGYGSSLGAYCALYFCATLDCDVVAISPRISVHPRFGVSHWQAKIAFKHLALALLPPPVCRAMIVFDPKDPMDRRFMDGEILPYFSEAHELRAEYSGHPSGYFLSETGYVGGLLRSVIAGKPVPPFDRAKKASSPTYLHVLATACASRNKLRWALELADRSVRMNPKSPMAHRAQARILLAAGQPTDAKAAIDHAYALNPSDDVIRAIMAEVNRALGQPGASAEQTSAPALDTSDSAAARESDESAADAEQKPVAPLSAARAGLTRLFAVRLKGLRARVLP